MIQKFCWYRDIENSTQTFPGFGEVFPSVGDGRLQKVFPGYEEI